MLGYGSQGHAHALNLLDSGVDVRVGLREGSSSWAKAEEAGLRGRSRPREACKEADIIMVLLPDTEQARVYQRGHRARTSKTRDSLAFAHGFNIHFGQIRPPKGVDVWMIAPKGPGHLVRRTFEEGGGVPALVAVARRRDRQGARTSRSRTRRASARPAPACSTPPSRRRPRPTSSASRSCSAAASSSSSRRSFETLVEAGYQPESAYFETLHEVKLIVDLIYEGGIANMRYSISDTAEYGDMTRGPRIITDDTRAEMRKILDEIQSGQFAKEWILENQAGRPEVQRAARRSRPSTRSKRSASGCAR